MVRRSDREGTISDDSQIMHYGPKKGLNGFECRRVDLSLHLGGCSQANCRFTWFDVHMYGSLDGVVDS
jgi:hypothetical protein